MDAEKHEQEDLVNGWALGEHCKAVNRRVWFEDREGVRLVCVGSVPFYTYDRSDKLQHVFCACQLVEAKLAKQCDVVKAFGVHERRLQRARARVREHGIAGLLPQPKGPKGRRRGGGAVGRRIVSLWKHGHGRLDIAARVGVSEGTVRNVLKEKGLYPRPPQPCA